MTGIYTGLYPLGNILNAHTVPDRRAAFPCEAQSMYGTHLLHHLTAYGTGLTAGQIAVIALLEVYADLGSCLHFEAIHCRACFRYHALIRTIFVLVMFVRSFSIRFGVLGFADSRLRTKGRNMRCKCCDGSQKI